MSRNFVCRIADVPGLEPKFQHLLTVLRSEKSTREFLQKRYSASAVREEAAFQNFCSEAADLMRAAELLPNDYGTKQTLEYDQDDNLIYRSPIIRPFFAACAAPPPTEA